MLHVEQQRQRQIRLQAALVEFVEDHQRHAAQLGIALQHARQDAFRHHFQSGGRPDAVLAAHAKADGGAGLLAELLRQALRHVARRQPTRLQHNNAARQIGLSQQLQRQPGRFARAGRGRQQNLRRGVERLKQVGQHGADR